MRVSLPSPLPRAPPPAQLTPSARGAPSRPCPLRPFSGSHHGAGGGCGTTPTGISPCVVRSHRVIFHSGNGLSLPPTCDRSLNTQGCCAVLSSSWCLRPCRLQAPTGRDRLLSLLASPCGSALDITGARSVGASRPGLGRGAAGSVSLHPYRGNCS